MNRVILLAIMAAFFYSSKAQEIEGKWYGLLKVPGVQLRLVMNIEHTGDGLKATMDSPDQNTFGIRVSEVTFENKELRIIISAVMMEYTGQMEGEIIKGTFSQGGMSFPFDLSREAQSSERIRRPQEPSEPYPYHAEEVRFTNQADQIELAGTLTIPAGPGPHPGVVLISGSGPQNRDSEVFGHKPFLVLADHLTRNGIAVLRYDDRGTFESEGTFSTATTSDFANDVNAAVNYLKTRSEISGKRIGLIGHSEGGIIAPLAGTRSEDVAFMVLLAGTGFTGADILVMQQALIGRVSGMPESELVQARAINTGAFAIVRKHDDMKELESALSDYFRENMDGYLGEQKPAAIEESQFIASLVRSLATPWMKFFIEYDPVPALMKTRVPVLALIGEKDLQVPSDENLFAMEEALKKGGNRQVTVKKLPGLNHLFQECTTGSPAEYAGIEQTFAPSALHEISGWIQKITQ